MDKEKIVSRETFSDEGTIFRSILIKNGIAPYDARRMERYARFMLEENKKYNLTAITDEAEVAMRHFADSIYPAAEMIPQGAAVIDIGAGAGFPGIPIAIARPDIKLTSMDSTRKKTDFIKAGAELAGVDVKTVCGRAEEEKSLFGSFDVALARGVAGLGILCEICTPMLKVGGRLLAFKGSSAADELRSAANCMKILGLEGRLVKSELYEDHYIIEIKKVKTTPAKYPRRYGQIKKAPL